MKSDSTPTKIRRRRVLNLGINVTNANKTIIAAIPADTIARIITACNHPIFKIKSINLLIHNFWQIFLAFISIE